MGLITDKITYNVKVRGRRHLGVERNLDTVALARLINGPKIQERVRKGDMRGYYGHWPRVKFGMDPSEGGIVDGVAVSVPPAVRMIELSAEEDGTITHRIEFLDNAEGQIAQKLYESKVGGFSTAIDVVPGTNPQVPTGFFGADFVLEPNYDTNRGYRGMLDAVGTGEVAREEAMALMDAVVGESFAAARQLNAMLDALQAQHALALEALERVGIENDLLIGRLAAGGGSAVLDDSAGSGLVNIVRGEPANFERFKSMPLVELEKLPEASAEAEPDEAVRRRFGVKV